MSKDTLRLENRIGIIRVDRITWLQSAEAIKANLSETGQISCILPARRNGQNTSDLDIILSHREFDEIEAGDNEFIRYACDFTAYPDGSMLAGPMVREGLR